MAEAPSIPFPNNREVYPTLAAHAEQQGHGGYTHAVLLRNPNSCTALTLDEAKKYMQPVEDLGLSVGLHETSRDISDTVTSLGKILTPQTVLFVHAGDGGKGKTFWALNLAQQVDENIRGVPVVSLRGGRKNDFDRQIDPRNIFVNPAKALSEGRVRTVRPLVGILQFDGEELPFTSWAHVSGGASGLTSADVNAKRNHWLRKTEPGRWLLERHIALSAFLRTREFVVNHPGEKDSKAVELMISNGPQVAGTFRTKADLFLPEARVVQARKHMGPFVLGALAVGIPIGKKLREEDGPQTYKVTVPKDRRTYMQFDGEEQEVSGDFTLTIGIGTEEDAIHVLTV
jgi:hypothetical protein